MSQAIEFRRPENVKVRYRRMKFDFEDGFDRYWHGGSPFRSLFWTQLSSAFEPGEKFFIDSARALRSQVDDPQLLEEVGEFCKQEGHHTAQHLKFDKINEEMGIDIAGCRGRYAKILDGAREGLTPLGMLSATMALEHFTAGFAEMFFKRPDLNEGGDPRVLALWAWHAAEEMEHKATAYDVYRAAGGGYFRRVGIMPFAWLDIILVAVLNTLILLKKDGKLFTWDTLKGFGYLFGFRGLVTGMLPSFFAYLSPRFHPWQSDDSEEIVKWQAANSQYIQNLEQLEQVA